MRAPLQRAGEGIGGERAGGAEKRSRGGFWQQAQVNGSGAGGFHSHRLR